MIILNQIGMLRLIFYVIEYLLVLSEAFHELMKTANEREAALLYLKKIDHISTRFAYLKCIQFI